MFDKELMKQLTTIPVIIQQDGHAGFAFLALRADVVGENDILHGLGSFLTACAGSHTGETGLGRMLCGWSS